MTAYDAEMTKDDAFSVTINADNEFEDDYAWLYVGSIYSQCIETFGEGNVKAINDYGYTDRFLVDNITVEDIKWHCASRGVLFVHGDHSAREMEGYANGEVSVTGHELGEE